MTDKEKLKEDIPKNELKKYSKKQFLKSGKFSGVDKNILQVLLKDDEKYSEDEVKKKLQEYKKSLSKEEMQSEKVGNTK